MRSPHSTARAPRVPAARMTIVGDGPDEAAARALIDRLGLSQRRGVCRREAARRSHPAARAPRRSSSIRASPRPTAIPRAARRPILLEAQAIGTPIVLDPPCGHPERRARRRRACSCAANTTSTRLPTRSSPRSTGREAIEPGLRRRASCGRPGRSTASRTSTATLASRRGLRAGGDLMSARERPRASHRGHVGASVDVSADAEERRRARGRRATTSRVVATRHEPWATDADRDVRSRRTWPVHVVDYRRDESALTYWRTGAQHRAARAVGARDRARSARRCRSSRARSAACTPRSSRTRSRPIPADLIYGGTTGALAAIAEAARRAPRRRTRSTSRIFTAARRAGPTRAFIDALATRDRAGGARRRRVS